MNWKAWQSLSPLFQFRTAIFKNENAFLSICSVNDNQLSF